MKRLLLLLPLLLTSCGEDKIYTNVYYTFNYDRYVYVVDIGTKKYDVPIENYHEVRVSEYKECHGSCNGFYVRNEFFMNRKVLYAYYK